VFTDLIGKKVDDSFILIPPFYTTGGVDISVGRNVFINQNCTFYDLGGLDIADDCHVIDKPGNQPLRFALNASDLAESASCSLIQVAHRFFRDFFKILIPLGYGLKLVWH
jgi:hypothetical protein